MERTNLILRVAGVTAVAIGALCLPVGYGVNPKRDFSAFSNLADVGIFVPLGLIMIAIGAIPL